jgi:PTH1 family peptidyl-tRNA hydrolase
LDDTAPKVRLIAGLGNPGREYERTRHNVGFMVVDRLASNWQLKWETSAKWGVWWTKGKLILVKPATYMNRSGHALSALAQFYQIPASEILVVLDDLALPLGRLRLRTAGSSGGHNGLESVLEHFATDAVPRLRIGIGAAPGEDAVDYVLGRFFEEETPLVEKTIARAAEAAEYTTDHGVLAAMNIFNKAEETTP